MNKPPDPLFFFPQPTFAVLNQPFYSFSIAMPSTLRWSLGRCSFAPLPRPEPLMAFFLPSPIQCPISAALRVIYVKCSTLSMVLTAKIGSIAPEGKPTTFQSRFQSRTVRSPAILNHNPFSIAMDLVLQIQGFLQQKDGAAPLNRFEIVFILCAFQVGGLNLYTIIGPFTLLWFFSDALLICCCTGFGWMSLGFGLSHCYVCVYCRPLCWFNLCLNLKSGTAVCWSSGRGLVGILSLTFDYESLNFVPPVLIPLNPVRCSIIFSFDMLMESYLPKYLVGNATLLCPAFPGLSIDNHVLKDCGNCLGWCIGLALSAQILNSIFLESFCCTHCAIVISSGSLDALKHDSSCGFLGLLLGCFLIEPNTCWCVVLGWVVRFSLWWFGACPIMEWQWSCRIYVINNNAILFLCNLNRRNHVGMQLNYSRFSCYFGWHSLHSEFLGNGVRTISGSIIRLSIALRCGGQLWLLTPENNLPCYHGSMLRISPHGTFSFQPSSLLFGIFRLQRYVSVYGNVFSSVIIFFFNPPFPFELLLSSLIGTFAWDNKSSGPSRSHRVILLMDVSFSQWLNCLPVCSKGVFSLNKNILLLLKFVAIYSCALLSPLRRISYSSLVEKFLPASECTIWWTIWSMITLGDATSGCIRLQAQKLQMQEISHTIAILSWIGNPPTLICCWHMHIVLMRSCQLFYWMEDLLLLLCCNILCVFGLMSLIWLLLWLASEDRRGCISFRNSKALFQTAFGLRLQLLWLRFICLAFSTEPSPSKIFLR